MIRETLQNAIDNISKLNDVCKQLEQDNNTLTDSIKTLEDEQKQGDKTFNNNTHILLERCALNNLINDVDDVAMSADNTADSASQAQSDIENIDYYNAEEAYNGAKDIFKEAEKISDKLHDLLNTEDVQPLAEEGTENA